LHSPRLDYILKTFMLDKGLYPAVFAACMQDETALLAKLFDITEEYSVSRLIEQSGIQDSYKYRCHQRSFAIANAALDEKGEMDLKALTGLISLLESQGYIPFPHGYSDAGLTEHILKSLRKWESDKGLRVYLKKFQMPLCHKYAERLIRDTIGIEGDQIISDRDLRVAVLAACLFPIRQNVGSCFATAPAILIQKEQPENLLADLYDLLTLGKMNRTIAGKEHSVPLSPSIGIGDLRKSMTLIPKHLDDMPPGFRVPLEMTGIIPKSLSKLDRLNWFWERLEAFYSQEKNLSVESFFHFVTLAHLQVTEEDMERFRGEEQSLLRRVRKMEIIHDTRHYKRRERFESAQFLEDRLKRLFISMTENTLARAWEYTIASLSETKMEFSRWNLYSSLGLNHEEPGGLGQIIYRFVEERIALCNGKLEEYQRDYEIAFDQLRATETLLKQASNESDARRLKAEFQSRLYHMQACLDLRDRFYHKASFYPQLFSFFVKELDHRFPEYFQEIYDAQMQEVEIHDYEDSPAGFRLVYKHGRRDASLWTMIHTQEQFIDSLIDFFSFVEPQIAAACESNSCEDDIKEIIAYIIIHLRTEEFIVSAYERSAKVHQSSVKRRSLKEMQKAEKKPWSYTSGGVMTTLIKTYYRREGEVHDEPFTVEGALDLLTLIIETMKSLPYNFTAYFPKSTSKMMLMHSPTHAFLLLPYEMPFFEAWDENGFTYTWIRDNFLQPRQNFYSSISLSISEQESLLSFFSAYLPQDLNFKMVRGVKIEDHASLKNFSKKILKTLPSSPVIDDALDSFLYQALPLTPAYKWKDAVYAILEEKAGKDVLALLEKFPDDPGGYIPSRLIKEFAKAVYILFKGKVCLDFDLHNFVTKKAESLGLSSHSPLIFADTNWSQNYFGFVVSPITEELQLWRVAPSGFEGVFLRSWASYLTPGNRQGWGIYTRPQEYNQLFERKI